ncbi:MAG TPA: universal stress protein [Ktedonobacteraceae bacterium]
MFRHILVPLDGSLRAESALPVAARIARASAGMLILLRAVSAAPEHGQDAGSWPSLFQTAIQSEQEEAQQYLTKIAASPRLAGLALSVVAPHGPIVAAIQAAVQSYQVDLLVCCEQPACPGESCPLGPFAEQISHALDIPVLLLPEQEPLHHSLAEVSGPIGCLVAFTGLQPELALIPPATALLSALVGRRPGDLHVTPLRALQSQRTSERSATLDYPDPRPMASVYKQQVQAGRGAVLLKGARTNGKREERKEQERHRVVVLSTPLHRADNDALREVAAYPRLLVPLSEHLSHA